MTARLFAFVVWAAVAATAVFWGLRLFVSAPPAPANTVAAGTPGLARGDLTRVFGAEPVAGPAPTAPASSRFHLVGVVAPQPGSPARAGVALIAVDDKPARAYRIGAAVDERLVVQAVQGRIVSLGPRGAPAEVQLELPPLAPAATGRLPSGPGPGPGAAPATPRPGTPSLRGQQPPPQDPQEPPADTQQDPPGVPR